MRFRFALRLAAALLPLAAAIFTAAGCSTLNLGLLKASRAAPEEKLPTYTVDLHSSWGGSKRTTAKLEEPITVEEALNKANALGGFSESEVFIVRTVPSTGQRHRMAVAMNGTRVDAAANYAIYPNDIIVVRPNNSTVLDNILSPLGMGGDEAF